MPHSVCSPMRTSRRTASASGSRCPSNARAANQVGSELVRYRAESARSLPSSGTATSARRAGRSTSRAYAVDVRGDVREPAARQPQTHTGPEHPQRRTLEERRRRHPPVAGEPAGTVRSEQVCQHAARLEERCGRDPAAAPGAGGDLVRAQRARLEVGDRGPQARQIGRQPGARRRAGRIPVSRAAHAASQHPRPRNPSSQNAAYASAIARSPLCYGAPRSHGKPVGVRRGPRHCDQGVTLQEATGRTGRRSGREGAAER